MDCLKATEILSAAHDGEPVDPGDFAAATGHCHDCASCEQFARTLTRVDELIVQPAPPAFVDGLVRHLEGIAAEDARMRELDATVIPIDSFAPASTPARRVWSGRLVAYASAAAVLVLALGVTSIALLRGLGTGREATEMAGVEDTAMTAPLAATPETGEGLADGTRAADTLAGAAPAFITVDNAVWLLVGPAEVAPSELTTASSFLHALEDTGTPVQRTSYRGPAGDGSLYVRTAEDGYLLFERVHRTLGRREYVLTSGTPLLRFGEWPTLPGRFKTPQSADGSPTFRALAKDDDGVDVYVPFTGDIGSGFAVAPGTGPDDPAAGNPNWTWWEPLR